MLQNQTTIALHLTTKGSLNIRADIRFLFRLGIKKSCIFANESFEQNGNQFILTKLVNNETIKIYYLWTNKFYVAYKIEVFENVQDMWHNLY